LGLAKTGGVPAHPADDGAEQRSLHRRLPVDEFRMFHSIFKILAKLFGSGTSYLNTINASGCA
jgi:hypothetical protein